MKQTAIFRHRAGRYGFLKWLCCVALVTAAAQNARAGFVAGYDFSDFTLYNSFLANGSWSSAGSQLILTGPSVGDGLPGTTDFIITTVGPSYLSFVYNFATLDDPTWEYAGYILTDSYSADCVSCFHQFADADGEQGTLALNVLQGQTFGFRVGSLDDTGYPGILTVMSNDTTSPADAPEPASPYLFLLGSAALLALEQMRRRRHPIPVGRTVRVLASALLCMAAPLLAQTQSYYSGSNVTGQLTASTVVNLSQQQSQGLLDAVRVKLPETLRKIPPHALRPATVSTDLVRGAANSPAATQPLTISASSTSTGFNALSHRDQDLADSGNQWSIEPPNGNIAVANGYVLEGVNDAVEVFGVTGTPRLPLVLSSNQVFGLSSAINWSTGANGPYLTDMRTYYDQDINRWIVLQRGQDNNVFGYALASSHLYMAVSKTSDPTGSYTVYTMDTTSNDIPGCPCIDDFPQIGSDLYGFHVAWNNFNAYDGLTVVGATILSISKAGLLAAVNTPTAFRFFIPYRTGYEFSLQPATTPPGASPYLASGGLEYFVSANINGYGAQLALWAMTNTSSLATVYPNPTLIQTYISVLNYSSPGSATQRPGALPYGESLYPQGKLASLDGGDTRVLSASYAGAALFVTIQSLVVDQNNKYVVGGAYMVLKPTYRNGVLNATVPNQGFLFVNGNHLLRPSVAVNAQGRGAIAVTLVGPDWYPSAALIPISTLTAPTTVQVAAAGTLPEDGFTGYPGGGYIGVARWGDYNSAVATGDGSIWMLMQYVGSYSRTQYANWNTYVARFQP